MFWEKNKEPTFIGINEQQEDTNNNTSMNLHIKKLIDNHILMQILIELKSINKKIDEIKIRR